MRLDDVWQQCVYLGYQVWVWLRSEAGDHPFMSLGVVIVIVSAWILYKSEVRTK